MEDTKFQGGINAVAESLRSLKAQTAAPKGLTDAQKLEALASAREVAAQADETAREVATASRQVLRELNSGPNVVPFMAAAELDAATNRLSTHVRELQRLMTSVIRG